MRLTPILFLSLTLIGSNGFSVDYVLNKLKSVQSLLGSLSQHGGIVCILSLILHLLDFELALPQQGPTIDMTRDRRGKSFLGTIQMYSNHRPKLKKGS